MARLAEGAVWAVLCTLLWLATVSSVTADEVAVAAAAGVVCGAAAVAGRRLTGSRWSLRTVPARWLLTLPVSVTVTTASVLAATLRRHPRRGRLRTVPAPRGDADAVSGREAIGAVALAAAPASYVVDIDADSEEVTVHTLADAAPDWSRVELGGRP